LDSFIFPESIRPIGRKRVANLERVFKTEGCKKDNYPLVVILSRAGCVVGRANFIKVVAGKHYQDFQAIKLNNSERNPEDGRSINCLKGQHRIVAAREFLIGVSQCWPVQVYRELTEEQKRHIIEGISFTASFTDGQILREVLEGRDDWKARFTGDDLKTLRRIEKHDDLWASLKKLTKFCGLWDYESINLGAFKSISIVRHIPELTRYLGIIHDF
ncbi:hypothetical protein BGX38DRAFT_1303277, partial [Terfezia claveryi]